MAQPQLDHLETQLASVYSQIVQHHGLPLAMQALGRLMISAPAPPATPAPPSAVRQQAAASPFSAAAGTVPPATPMPAATPAAPPPSPMSIPGASQSVAVPDATTAAASGPGSLQQQPQQSPSGLAHSQTIESIRTMASPTMSQMPSGIMSLVSPSAAASVLDADERSQNITSGDLDAVAATAAATGANRGSGGGGGDDAGTGAGVVGGDGAPGAAALMASAAAGPMDVPRAAAAAVAAVAAARAAAVQAAEDAGGQTGGGEPDSPRSNLSTATKGFGTPRSGSLWQRAVNLSKAATDPWAGRNIHTLAMERAVRQRYNAMTGQWVTDEVLVKVEAKPFAAGAMRECYAAKKLSTFTHNVDWHKAQNMVAKSYKKEGVRKSVYYNDVLVQMDAKMLGECYNKTDPPKQVDVMQCALLQFPDRPHKPVYAVEQLIEGDYVKYNSNSGFVKGDDLLRNTPQAFSHFTWVLTKGLKICVDIQGVGDLYTDPQLHTLDGEGYGEGNLGLRGMALFFRSHECNALCCRLGLKPLDRCDADVRAQGYDSASASASGPAARSGGPAVATATRTLARTASYRKRMVAAHKRRQLHPGSACGEEALLAGLKNVPKESPESLVHLEIAKMYGEVVLLPELRPLEDPEDALRGGLFHLGAAAQGGALVALLVLARAHCGIEVSAPQYAHMFKAGARQRLFEQHVAVAWRCTLLAAERGVRGAALAAAAAYGSGSGLFGDEVLGGKVDPVQAVRWYAAALALPDLVAEAEAEAAADAAEEDEIGAIHEGDEEEEETEEEGGGSAKATSEDEEEPQFDMSVMRDKAHSDHGSLNGLDELLLLPSASSANLANLRVPKLEELRASRAFLARIRLAAEEEASSLPGATAAKYEILYEYGSLLLAGGDGLVPAPAKAAGLLEQAAEEASEAGKGKLAQKYFEAAAKAQAACS